MPIGHLQLIKLSAAIYTRDRKLRVLSYWFYAFVPDERRGMYEA